MIRWVTQLQYIRGRNVWFVGLLDAKRDDFNREFFEPQIEGAKTGLELPGIVDQVVTMTELRTVSYTHLTQISLVSSAILGTKQSA